MKTLAVLIVFYSAALIKSDHIEYDCRDVQCPLPDFKCSPDSELRSSDKSTDDEDDVDENSMHFLRKRSLQHREPIKIVAKDVDRSFPELSKYHNLQQSHRRQRRDLVINVQPQTEAEIKKCCPEFQCVCKSCPDVPKCDMGFVAILIEAGHGLPGSCCSKFECVPQWECNSPGHPNISYYKDKCTYCDCFGDHELCQKLCDHAEDESANNCFSSYHKRPILNGDSWIEENGCRECKCVNGENQCQESFCQALDCPNPMRIEGRCCSICPTSSTSAATTSTEENNTPTVAQEEEPTSSTTTSAPVTSTSTTSTSSIPTPEATTLAPTIEVSSTTTEPATSAPPASTLPTETDFKDDIATPTVTVKQWRDLEDKKIIYISIFVLSLSFILLGTTVYYYTRCHKKKNKESLYSTIPSCESSQTSSGIIA